MTLPISGLTDEDVRDLVSALATAASRHEAQAHAAKHGRHHDELASRMRALRLKLMKARVLKDWKES